VRSTMLSRTCQRYCRANWVTKTLIHVSLYTKAGNDHVPAVRAVVATIAGAQACARGGAAAITHAVAIAHLCRHQRGHMCEG
jgi:hypothetical protein